MLHDSGKREKFETGAVRDTREGKGRYDLIPAKALMRLAKIYEEGAEKYDDRNWEKGIPVSRCIDSAIRHLIKYLDGWQDEDHLAAVLFNIMAVMHFEETREDMCDLPWQEAYKKNYDKTEE